MEKIMLILKKYSMFIRIFLVVLTFLAVALDLIFVVREIYSTQYIGLNITDIGNFVSSKGFNLTMKFDSFFIYLFAIPYFVDTFRRKKEIIVKISFGLISVLLAPVSVLGLIKLVVTIFGIM